MRTEAKTERLMKLLIMLLVQRRYVSRQRIREILYPDAGDDAFERMFERDKDELRSIGVPIETGQLDAFFDDEPGYRIRPDEFALPDVDLDPEEAAVVGLASRVWEHQRLARATTEAVRKLTASGVDIDVAALDIARPRLGADEPSFDVFYEAILTRTPVRFDHARDGHAEATTRHLRPWGVTRYAGRWYVVGFDTDRGAERVFRLSRVRGEAVLDGRPGSYEIPADIDISATTRRLAPTPDAARATVLARSGTARPLRQAADRVETDVAGPDTATGWDRLVITRGAVGLADEILAHATTAVVEEPAELRAAVVARLEEALAAAGAGSGTGDGP